MIELVSPACQHRDGKIDIAAAEQQMAHASLVVAVLKKRMQEGGAAIRCLAVRDQACPEPLRSQAFAVCLDACVLTSKETFPIKDFSFLNAVEKSQEAHPSYSSAVLAFTQFPICF